MQGGVKKDNNIELLFAYEGETRAGLRSWRFLAWLYQRWIILHYVVVSCYCCMALLSKRIQMVIHSTELSCAASGNLYLFLFKLRPCFSSTLALYCCYWWSHAASSHGPPPADLLHVLSDAGTRATRHRTGVHLAPRGSISSVPCCYCSRWILYYYIFLYSSRARLRPRQRKSTHYCSPRGASPRVGRAKSHFARMCILMYLT